MEEKRESNASERSETRSQFTHHKGHHHAKTISKKLNLGTIFIGLTALLGIILIINLLITFNISKEFKKSEEASKEKLKPAKIELTLIKHSKCKDCFDISTVVGNVKKTNANITKETTLEFDSQRAKEIISKYKIEKIPTIVITGEIDKINLQGLEKKGNILMLTKLEPPYTNAATGKIEGRVALINLNDPECAKCNDLNFLAAQFRLSGIKITSGKNVSSRSDEGKELIKKYNIDFVPTIILSKDAAFYPLIQQAWPRIGSKEADGSYVLRLVNPPFINLTTGKLRGVVSIIYLSDKGCSECYNVNLHREIITSPQNYAINLDKEETVDINDPKGKEFINKYNISQVPTIILSEEAQVYPSSQSLKQFFSVEKDGSYVFRKLSVVGAYKDLTTNKIVKPIQQSQGVA